ncbi:MAG: 5'-methylthioadenosine/adenosylhomocysteine nucleosidase [Clostridia bacterium]|nr:5'-methylthioadenosine/adenosylhomocysteine nucleosidase [Clostridia bacterium]
MLGIIAAMQKEMDLIAEAMSDPVRESVGGVEFVKGELSGYPVVCSVCGIGKVFAAMCAEAMIIKYSPELIVNTGVGGTLTKELSIGDVAVSSAVCQHDMDTTAIGDEAGLISGINKVYFEADSNAADAIEAIAADLGINTLRGVIASGDVFVASNAQKERITSLFGAVSCEMEGGAVGHVCYVNKTPFAVIRAISDDADGGAVDDYPAFAAASAKKSASIVVKLAEKLAQKA